jgi:cytochrome P450
MAFCACIRQVLIVAMVAPAIIIAAMTRHLCQDKELQQRLRGDPSLIPAAVEEFVRLYTPYRGFSRTSVCPVTISGQEIKPKEPIAMTYAAANRDPAHFKDPDKFILNRENIHTHLGFGRGKHRCAGMVFGRTMLRVFLQVLFRQTEDLDMNGEPEYARLPEVGMIGCPVRFTV